MHFGGKHGGGTLLVVVLQKARAVILKGHRRAEMGAHRAGFLLAQPIVQPFIIGVCEPLLLQDPLQIPVHLGQEHKIRMTTAHVGEGVRPEGFLDGGAAIAGPSRVAPRLQEHIGQEQHGHIAAHAVAAVGDAR